jgi:VanZ family protein
MPETKNRKYYWRYHFPWQVLMVIIFTLSSIGQEDMPGIVEKFSDKFLHFIVFGLLGVLLVRSFRTSRLSWLRMYAPGWGVFLSSLYGVLDELHQLMVPGRHSSMMDWLADTGGAALLIILYVLFTRKKSISKSIHLTGKEIGHEPAGDQKSG